MMKVALLTNFIPPYRKSLYTELDKQLDSLTVFISQTMEDNRNWEVDHGALNVVVQKGVRYSKKWKGEFGYQETSIVQIPYDTFFKLKKYKPEVVISAELGMRSVLSALYCKRFNKPLILWLALSEHTEKNKKGVRLRLRKRLLKSANAILCNGKSAERYIESLGIQKKTFFVPCTSDFEISNDRSANTNGVKTILFTGQLIKRKGIEEMVAAFLSWSKLNPNTTVNLIIAGDGPERDKFEPLLQLSNIQLTLLGVVEYGDLQPLYKTSDVYIFPTLADEWGVVVNEAMASGLPILGSTYSQAIEELVNHEENGWVFKPDNHDEFVNRLTIVINATPEKLTEISEKGVETIQKMTPNNVAHDIYKAIDFVRGQ